MHYRTVSFSLLELDGLIDPQAEPAAYVRAIDKVIRVRDGRPGRQSEGAKARRGTTRGRELDLRRRSSRCLMGEPTPTARAGSPAPTPQEKAFRAGFEAAGGLEETETAAWEAYVAASHQVPGRKELNNA